MSRGESGADGRPSQRSTASRPRRTPATTAWKRPVAPFARITSPTSISAIAPSSLPGPPGTATRARRRGRYDPRPSGWAMTRLPEGSDMSATPTQRKIRVVVAKPGLDGHDRGAKIIARALRDAGMEVIYTGLHQTPEQIVETVIQEDADAVGLSILSGAHMTLVPRIVDLLSQQGVDDVLVTVGGTIPADDIAPLKELGVAEVFTPGAPTQDIIERIRAGVGRAAR